MVVGLCLVDIHIPENSSLKGKRQVMKRILERVKNRFNVSIAEVDDNDLWQRGKIARASGVCKVQGDIVSEAEVTFVLVDAA
jgi:uncharacterized protein YlxP (DUF503 family)